MDRNQAPDRHLLLLHLHLRLRLQHQHPAAMRQAQHQRSLLPNGNRLQRNHPRALLTARATAPGPMSRRDHPSLQAERKESPSTKRLPKARVRCMEVVEAAVISTVITMTIPVSNLPGPPSGTWPTMTMVVMRWQQLLTLQRM
jgi:hypothetical protein